MDKLITHKEFIEWTMKTKISQKNVGLLCGCGTKAAHIWVHNPKRFEGGIARVVIDIMVRVPGAMERRIEQIGEAWKK